MPPINGALPFVVSRPNEKDAARPMFRTLGIASSGLSAQRLRMEVIAQNVANAQTTRTVEGGPYRRKFVELMPNGAPVEAARTAALAASALAASGISAVGSTVTVQSATEEAKEDALGGVAVAGIREDASEGPLVYDPAHPDADANGYVRMPNVNVTAELTSLMEARRIYEANATVFQSAKQMLRRAIDI